jgi:hypothetical protein
MTPRDPLLAMEAPRAIDLFCGLGGWTEGLLAHGYDVTGYDIETHEYGEERYPAKLVLQDVLTLDGAQFADAALIVASPPCQEFSYMAMPWKRAKQIARALRGQDEFPAGYRGSRTIAELTALFDACFRIQSEASEAAGRKIPLVVENVRGAEPWVGRARWSFGSYYLWGDVPALMPKTLRAQKFNPDGSTHGPGSWFAVANSQNRGAKSTGGSWFNIGSPGQTVTGNNPDGRKNPGFRFDGSGKSFQSESVARHVEGVKVASVSGRRTSPGNGARFTSLDCGSAEGRKHHGDWFRDPDCPSRQGGQSKPQAEGRKGAGAGAEWFDANLRALPSKSPRRKAASAKIAKIPLALSAWVARTYNPAKNPGSGDGLK